MSEKKFFNNLFEEKLLNKEKIRNNVITESCVKSKKTTTSLRYAIIYVFIILTTLFMSSPLIFFEKMHTLNASAKTINNYNNINKVIDGFIKQENAFNVSNVFARSGIFFSDAITTVGENFSFTSTNVQTEGIDEGDIVKTDGYYIYKLTTKGCFIIAVNNGQMEVVANLSIDNYVPKEMYVHNNQLILIGGVYKTYYNSRSSSVAPLLNFISFIYYTKTDIRIYDITNKSEPVLSRQITLDGNLNTSRLNIAENKLTYMVDYYINRNVPSTYIPKVADTTINDGEETLIPSNYIYYYDDLVNYNYLIMGQIDLETPENTGVFGAYLGLGGIVYVSNNNIYVSSYDYQSKYKVNVFGWVSDAKLTPKTRIIKIELDTLSPIAVARVNGRINDRYWMDEYNGYLRVATQDTVAGSNVFVLDSQLQLMGQINNIAAGERIYSARFNGETGSLVTFLQVDPYFNLNLTDPTNPTISDGLKEDGVSHYIHYIPNSNYTIGIGQMSEVVTRSWGERVIFTGLKVSLYDNSSGEAVNVNTFVLSGACYSELFSNPKALMFDEENNTFAFSYQNWTYAENSFSYSSMTQGLAVFSYNIDTEEDEDKLTYRQTLTNIDPISPYGGNYYNKYFSFITRGIRINNTLYTISDALIVSYDLTTLEEIETLAL